MTPKNITLTLLVLILLSLRIYNRKSNIENLFIVEEQYNETQKEKKSYEAIVKRVIDGDTIEVIFYDKIPENCSNTEKIRFVGVNTPELNLKKKEGPEFFAQEAYEFTNKELYRKTIELKFDDISNQKDKYNRLLCYVFIDGFCFNQILIEQGYGKYYGNFKFNENNMINFKKAEEYAKKQKLGMWK